MGSAMANKLICIYTPPKKSKYRAKPTIVDGIRFASKKEARRYSELVLLQKSGKITDLKLQVRIPCVVNLEKVCVYVCDFWYIDRATHKEVIEDCKGFLTPIYKLKRKLVHACTGITITEV